MYAKHWNLEKKPFENDQDLAFFFEESKHHKEAHVRLLYAAEQHKPLALLIGIVILMQLGIAFGVWETSEMADSLRAATPEAVGGAHNTQALGLLLYDDYLLLFQLSGLILLVAMIGAIVLTLRHRVDVKRQDVVAQMMRDPAKAMELKDVKPGQGL